MTVSKVPIEYSKARAWLIGMFGKDWYRKLPTKYKVKITKNIAKMLFNQSIGEDS